MSETYDQQHSMNEPEPPPQIPTNIGANSDDVLNSSVEDVASVASLSEPVSLVEEKLSGDDMQKDVGPGNTGGTEKNDVINESAEPASPPTKCSKEIISNKPYLFADEMKFMENFDPNQRLTKKKLTKFTKVGVVEEICDCLKRNCKGCHNPCNTCESRLCGHVCRKGRSWMVERVEVEGKGIIRTDRVSN